MNTINLPHVTFVLLCYVCCLIVAHVHFVFSPGICTSITQCGINRNLSLYIKMAKGPVISKKWDMKQIFCVYLSGFCYPTHSSTSESRTCDNIAVKGFIVSSLSVKFVCIPNSYIFCFQQWYKWLRNYYVWFKTRVKFKVYSTDENIYVIHICGMVIYGCFITSFPYTIYNMYICINFLRDD